MDNYCRSLIIAEQASTRSAPWVVIVCDGDTHPYTEGYAHFWKTVDRIGMSMGFTSLWSMMKLPDWFLYPIAYICKGVTALTGKQVKLNPFNVAVLTMHRWFKIGAAERDLSFQPIVGYEEGVEDTCSWFKENWFPDYLRRKNATNSDITSYCIAQQSIVRLTSRPNPRVPSSEAGGCTGRKGAGARSQSKK